MAPSLTVGVQHEIREWFDGVYRDRGLSYLRPAHAYPVFLDLLEVDRGAHLLDVACGPGLLLAAARRRGLRATGIDLSPVAIEMLDEVAPGAEGVVGNAEALPFEDASFDYLTCIGAIERFVERERALAEMARVLRPGGRACVMVRNADHLSWRRIEALGRKNHAGHQDAASLSEWRALLQRGGFSSREVYPDQWTMQRLYRRMRLDRLREYQPRRWPQPVLRWANEFIFVLERRG